MLGPVPAFCFQVGAGGCESQLYPKEFSGGSILGKSTSELEDVETDLVKLFLPLCYLESVCKSQGCVYPNMKFLT